MHTIKQCLCSIGTWLVFAAGWVGVAVGWQATIPVPPMFGDCRVIAPTGLILGTGALNVGEHESPLPQNRVFFNYNYYANVQDLS